MQRRTWLVNGLCGFGITLALVVCLVLLADITTFDLEGADLATGRVKGCYTLIDDLLHTTAPLGWARSIEFGLAILAVVAGVMCGRAIAISPRQPSVRLWTDAP